MFDELRRAVNQTHGSLHHAFIAWDKGGTGSLTKARLRVGLRACRGAKEREVENFVDTVFNSAQSETIGFREFYETFQKNHTSRLFSDYRSEVTQTPVSKYQGKSPTPSSAASDRDIFETPKRDFLLERERDNANSSTKKLFEKEIEQSNSVSGDENFSRPGLLEFYPDDHSPKYEEDFGESEINQFDLLDPLIRAALKANLLSNASPSPSFPKDSFVSPSDLRRCIHYVDPSLSRIEVKALANLLAGDNSSAKVSVWKVLGKIEEMN